MELRKEKKRSVIINLTSLIDVLFLMLIFFMVTTTFLSQPAINLELPTAKNAEAVRQSPVVVHVDRLGRVFLNEALSRRVEQSDDKSVVLKADSRVSHGAVVQVLDIIKGAGVRKLVVSTEPESR
ncbi:MAG: biopolymer transporter ExbD [Candidatus Krumholzibacteriota bacterium]|nr:biopolymer transporter ExbD [Candidatus Krumholzibacteriota bacterium]